MISVKDFASQKGVSVQAIYKHIRAHQTGELTGHFEKRGKNGTWLDDFACEFISGLMLQQPIVISDNSLLVENEALKKEITELYKALAESQKQTISLAGELRQADKALNEVNTLLLSAHNDQLRATALEEENKTLQSRATALEQEKESLEKALEQEKKRKRGFFNWF